MTSHKVKPQPHLTSDVAKLPQSDLSQNSMNLIHRKGAAVKTTLDIGKDAGVVEGYLVSWGNPTDTDLQGEFFTDRTEFCLDWFVERPVLYHHGLDGEAGLRKIGSIKSIHVDKIGLWVQAQLDMQDRYAVAVYDMVKSHEFGWSSGSVDHLVKIAATGEIVTWPLIEGSITPTPAQPSKTTVRAYRSWDDNLDDGMPVTSLRAFKAILSNDVMSQTYLRGLNQQLEARVNRDIKYSQGSGVKSYRSGELTSDDFIDADTDAALTALEEEMVQETKSMARQFNTHKNVGRSSRPYRNEESYGAPVVNSPANELTAQAEDLAVQMANEMASDIEDEIRAELEQEEMTKRMARAIQKKAMRRAYRNIVATDDVEAEFENAVDIEAGGQGDLSYLGEFADDNLMPNSKSMRRNRPVRSGSRARRANTLDDIRAELEQAQSGPSLDEIKEDENSILVEEVAAQAFRNGVRTGIRRAFRTTDAAGDSDALVINQSNSEPGNVNELDDYGAGVVTTKRYGNRQATRRTSRARRNEEFFEGEATMADEDLDTAVAPANDLVSAARNFRKGYRAAMSNAKRNARRAVPDDGLDYEVEVAEKGFGYRVQDDGLTYEATMSDDMDSDDMETKSYRNRSSKSVKSAENYWKEKALSLQNMEAPSQRTFNRAQIVDEADQKGAYNHAFKSYLRVGMGLLNEREKNTLRAKGQTNWGEANTFSRDGGAYKTYSGGSDASVGFAVPPDWVDELNRNIMTQTVMAAECRTRVTTSDVMVQPNVRTSDARRMGAATVSWPGENPASSASSLSADSTFSQINIPINVMLINKPVTNSALEDVSFDLEAFVNEEFSEAVAIAYDELIWSGDGQGKLLGIVSDPDITTTASTGMTIPGGYVASGSASGIPTADTLMKMMYHLPLPYRQRAKWYMNSNTLYTLSTLKDGNGNYLIGDRNGSLEQAGGVESLLRKPIVVNEWADDIAANAFPIILGDLSKGYIIGKRVEFSIRRFDDSQQAVSDQVLFLGRARLGGAVLQPAAIKVMKVAVS
jgi:HK97 family phage major capsid protein